MSRNTSIGVTVIVWSIVGCFFLLWLFPLVKMFEVSFQGGGINNYIEAMSKEGFARSFFNSSYVTVINLVISTVCIVMASYAFSKLRFPFKGTLMLLCICGLMIPPSSLIVPVFLQTQKLGLINNTLGIIGPRVALSIPFGVLITKAFFDDIPNEIIEAAKIDGASNFQTMLNVIIPIGKPAIATVLIFNFLSSWKDFLFPFIMLHDYKQMTVALLPQRFIDSLGGSNVNVLYAVLVLSSVPIFIAYLLGEKRIESGLTAGSVK